jgi:hypothetical protein
MSDWPFAFRPMPRPETALAPQDEYCATLTRQQDAIVVNSSIENACRFSSGAAAGVPPS